MIATSNFEEQYVALRKSEQRLYTDEQVQRLPDIEALHPHYREWQLRKSSCDKLIEYLSNKNKTLDILEVGCGNGWLSGRLASLRAVTITATDINKTELSQARRLFEKKPNLSFKAGDIRSLYFDKKFDIIFEM